MITVTKEAALKIKEQLKKRGRGLGIKIGVRTSGCSGMAYTLEFVDEVNMWMDEYKSYGVSIFAEANDITYLNGLQVHWKKEGLNEGFEFINPNEKGRCGCGESFTV